MPVITVNDIKLNYYDNKPPGGGPSAPTVLLVMGSGGSGRAWHLHQVPALVAAGFRVVSFDNRGIAPSDECPSGFGIDDLVADTAALIEELRLGPCLVAGISMGAHIAQELALARPELVSRMVLMATRARPDVLRDALSRAEIELYDRGVELPAAYAAVVQAMQNLSPRTREAYRGIRAATRVIAFQDDLIAPPGLGREVADAIPGAEFEVVPDCGHYGYLESPDAVNKSIVEFLRG
ncbi:alpha/beta fold hydrolase [Streptomyces sp. NRRL S-481]|uniref:alpha/beta fold hydrolase n=1 Tax=Streptomyces sp. NRRL S-481 TaxID=1463911 RepID=UPI0004CAF835|nr:alpha/beta fold hydrolase [Streptomyces sp. NRRL S-481]